MTAQKRYLEKLIAHQIAEVGGYIQIVIGPGQDGKTTAVLGALANRGVYASADSPSTLTTNFITEHWIKAADSSDRILALDEIQKIPGWSKRLSDSGIVDPNFRRSFSLDRPR